MSYKIIVSCHKPALLPTGTHYIPVHCGRALGSAVHKDGAVVDEDYNWLLENTVGDDIGDNISSLNRQFNEMTAVYSVWKNYESYGNPDYIGFCHYRRILSAEDVADFENYDIVAHFETYDGVMQQFISSHHVGTLETVLEHAKQLSPYANIVEKFKVQKNACYRNIFLMKKELFFEYCEFIFPLLFQIHASLDYDKLSFYGQRMPAFIAERLTALFMYKKIHEGKKIKEVHVEFVDVPLLPTVKPAFHENNIPVIFASDENYAPYLCVTIASLTAHASSNNNYDICIFEQGFTDDIKNKILAHGAHNISIRFIDISPIAYKYKHVNFSVNAHFTPLTYFRFFIPEVFKNYVKALYLDCDIIILHDVAELYQEDLHGYAIAAARDVEIVRQIFNDVKKNEFLNNYLTTTLKISVHSMYFQAGVLILDIPKLIEFDFTHKCIAKLQEIKKPIFVDQDVLNSVFDGNIQYFDISWNVEWHLPMVAELLINELPSELYLDYMQSRKNPKIVHYSGSMKPWKEPHRAMAHHWWKYAKQTLFYEEIVYRNTRQVTIPPLGAKLRQKVFIVARALYHKGLQVPFLSCILDKMKKYFV